jgi:hypothetical protein
LEKEKRRRSVLTGKSEEKECSTMKGGGEGEGKEEKASKSKLVIVQL